MLEKLLSRSKCRTELRRDIYSGNRNFGTINIQMRLKSIGMYEITLGQKREEKTLGNLSPEAEKKRRG